MKADYWKESLGVCARINASEGRVSSRIRRKKKLDFSVVTRSQPTPQGILKLGWPFIFVPTCVPVTEYRPAPLEMCDLGLRQHVWLREISGGN